MIIKILIVGILILILIGIPLFNISQGGESSGKHSLLDIITYQAFDESDSIYPIDQAFSVIGKCKRDGWDTCKISVI